MLPALSIRAPWAWLIIHGGKKIENRTWTTGYRGRFLVHATGTNLKSEYEAALKMTKLLEVGLPPMEELPIGSLIGTVNLEAISSPNDVAEWADPDLRSKFYGWGDATAKYWWHLNRPVPHTPDPCPGQLGWFFP